MTSILVPPKDQWIDGNGDPIAGGFIYTYVPLTLNPKQTWKDKDKVVANTNPVLLDSDGRALIYGDGIYRFIVKDANLNVIYDAVTEAYLSDTSISSAMLPVTEAATLQTARDLMGVTAAIQSAVNGATTLTGPTGPSGPTGPIGNAGPTGSTASSYVPTSSGSNPIAFIFPNINGSTSTLKIQQGTSTTSSGGTITISFPIAFVSAPSLQVTCTSVSWWASITSLSASSFQVTTSSPLHGGGWTGGPIGFTWTATGI